ncbi:kinase non-catalytic C-lobe domain-containing protein 1 isoform X3 [Dermochelys coriacea]|uniref:kinase non-catalytic C-lobe domain-containing protein 1 isoform X3 n=1 Tax=Dermochelys coriacea TaxID=27794 RepID=UPI001CA7BC1D|nr:kinase non-catalytic C-lobe domain-containing protein 1 isoform X3 [Dermochelys coriacea]
MEAVEAAVAGFPEEEEGCYDFEPLPTLLEDEENVSLADLLSLRDSCLTEQDIWAICLECSHSMKSISHSAIFQTLCITPDTLAFNTNGNVCFMEQLSDDPEGAFVPPEFDITGNTFEAHIYSLGATLKAAIEYVIESEMESEFGQDLQTLLEQMQEENPEDRPDIESIISLCEEKLKFASSSNICRNLSAVGRRVLSIESFSTFQDSCDNIWKGKVCQRSAGFKLYTNEKNNIEGDSSTVEDLTASYHRDSSVANVALNAIECGLKEMQIDLDNERSQPSQLATEVRKSKEEDKHVIYNDQFANIVLETKSFTNDIERDIFKKSLRKMKTFPKLPLEVTDTNNVFTSLTNGGLLAHKKLSLTHESVPLDNNQVAASGGKLSPFNVNNPPRLKPKNYQVSDLHLDASCMCTQVSGMYPEEYMPSFNGKKKASLSCNRIEECSHATSKTRRITNTLKNQDQSAAGAEVVNNYMALEDCIETSQGSNENCLSQFNKMASVLSTKTNKNGYGSSLVSSPELLTGVMSTNNNENHCGSKESEVKSNEQWVSLKVLLSRYGKPLKDYELWALCHECLFTLQTYMDYPVFLCLDCVLIDCHGNVLFAAPKDEGCYDTFYLAPEIEEVDFVTEKVCIYCVAAILWTAAKYNYPPDHKLVLPRKLKTLLLDMAKRNSEERPSLADAIKICSSYLLEQSINSKKILAFLSKSAFKAFNEEINSSQDNVPFEFKNKRNKMDASVSSLGFVPITSESKLIAVKGPVPCQTSLNSETCTLPVAFTSSATHFKPIILQQNTELTKGTHASTPEQLDRYVQNEMHTDGNNKSVFVDDIENHAAEEVVAAPEIPKHDLDIQNHSSQIPSNEQNPSNMVTSTVELPSPSDSLYNLQEKNTLSAISSSSSACSTPQRLPLINNSLLKQDPETRVLTLVPVQLAVSEQIPNKPLESKIAYDCYNHLPVLLSSTIANYNTDTNLQNNSFLCQLQNYEPTKVQTKHDKMKAKIFNLSLPSTNQIIQTSYLENKECNTEEGSSSPLPGPTSHSSVNQNASSSFSVEILSQLSGTNDILLQKAVHLIQEEFAFDGYLENGVEVLAMGNYIFTLKELKFDTFCDAVSEKFCDLYWDEKLLENLYKVVSGKTTPQIGVTETDGSQRGSMFHSLKTSDSFLVSSKQTKEGKERLVASDTKAMPTTDISLAEMDLHELPLDNFEKELRLQKVILRTEKDGSCLQSNDCLGPDFVEENREQEEETSENNYPVSPSSSDFQSCSPGWSSAFNGGECFSSEVYNYVKKLGKQEVNESQNIDSKRVELEQILMIETKNYRKTIKFYQKLLQKERRNKGSEVKSMLPKLRGQLQEMKSKVQFLELVKKYIQIMYAEQWGVESCALPSVVNITRTDMLDISPLDESLLIFYNMKKHQYNNQNRSRILQAGTPLGLIAYLYSSANEDPTSLLIKIYNRSFYILQAWIEDCYSVDFAIRSDFLCMLQDFISSKIAPLNGFGERLRAVLENATGGKCGSVFQRYNWDEWKEEEEDDTKSLHSLCKKLSEDVSQKSFNWKLSKGNGPIAHHQKERPYTVGSALPKPCYYSSTEEFSGSYAKANEGGSLLTEYSAQELCCQLTLLQQEMFHKCHPVHFLNSRALGVKDKCTTIQKAVPTESLSLKVCNLFLPNCIQDKYLLQLLRNADNISTWVAAEIVTSHTSKLQVNLLSKFLLLAKSCYEQRNFATAMQILRGLENLIVRQLPAWKILPSKVSEIMEELKAVEVFLKSDSLCLMEGERFKTLPTIPSAHVLAMHVQQLETGGFTMTNGAHKWTKLRNIAKVVSQVRAFQENPYTFTTDFKLQSYLKQRIAHFTDADISALAADNCANFHQIPAEKHSRKIQDTLRRMKATFQ